MLYLIKWIGQGILIKNIWFKSDSKKEGFFLVDKEMYSYLKQYFNKHFIILEKVKDIKNLTINIDLVERAYYGNN